MSKLKFKIAKWLLGYMKIELTCRHGAFVPGHYLPGTPTNWGCNESEDDCVKLKISYVKDKTS